MRTARRTAAVASAAAVVLALTACAGPSGGDDAEPTPSGSGAAEDIFPVLFGPCVINETTSALDNNDRSTGYVLAASG